MSEQDIEVDDQPKKPKKSKGGKKKSKRIFIVIPVLLLLGACIGAMTGMIPIPGVKKAKKPVAAKEDSNPPEKEKDKGTTPAASLEAAQIVEPKLTKGDETIDKEKGAKAIAKIWDAMEPESLLRICATYQPDDCAAIFSQMDADLVAEVLGKMEAKKAASISREIEKLGSIVIVQQ